MRYIFLSLLVSLLVSCEQSKEISEKEVMETFNEFFYLLDNDIDKIRNYLSEDFMIFEVSRKWNAEEFIEFVLLRDSKTLSIIRYQEPKWRLVWE